MIDETDRKILEILEENARTPNAEIARQVGMVPSAILERIRKLEERGVIEGYGLRVNPEAYGLSLTAFVFVQADERGGAVTTAERLAEIPEVQEIHHVAGEDCFLVKVRTTGTRALGALLRDRLGTIETIRSTRSTIVLETIKDTWQVSLPATPEHEIGE
jgi:Lrp/AsnC family leucine-responsive transcriptional regulator